MPSYKTIEISVDEGRYRFQQADDSNKIKLIESSTGKTIEVFDIDLEHKLLGSGGGFLSLNESFGYNVSKYKSLGEVIEYAHKMYS